MSRLHSRHLVSLLLAATVAAQVLPLPAVGAPAEAIIPWPTNRVLTDRPGNGSVWAATARWKAGFTAAGATFVPFLGSDAPSHAATFALGAVRCGEVTLPVAAAAPRLHDQRVAYERGAVREQYLLRQEGVEQQFVFAALPNRGALQLDVVVTTALQHRIDGDGHAFTGERGGVRYGRAIAIDATGREAAMTTTWTGEVLRLTVPAAFVATAALPLVVDPLVGPIVDVPASASVFALTATDSAWHHESGDHYVVYERAFSATDHDVYVLRLDAAMQPLEILTIDYTSDYWTRPRIATLEAHDLACVVAQTSADNVAPFKVSSRSFTCSAAPALGAVVPVGDVPGGNCLAPDIGGDSDPIGPSRFLIAYEAEFGNSSEVRCQLVAADGDVTPINIPNGIYFTRRVAVSKTCGRQGGDPATWALVYRAETTWATDAQLRASFITRSGTLVDAAGIYAYFAVIGSTTANAGSEWDVSSPTDGQLGRTFFCAEVRVDAGTGRGSVYGHAFDEVGNVLATNQLLIGGSVDRRAPAVDGDGCRFALAHTNVYSATDADVRANTVALVAGQLLVQDSAVVSFATTADRVPSVCAHHGGPRNRYTLAWIHGAASTSTVQAQHYHGVAAAGGFATRATGCGNLAITPAGQPALGEAFTVGLAPVTGIAGFLVGPPVSWSPPGCTCIVGADQLLVLGPQLQVHVPPVVALVGAVVACQGLQLLAGPGPCLGQFELSDTIDATIR